jgi:cytochrome b6-f complex iron-sulfur subunit
MNDQEQLSTAGASRRAVLTGGGAACLALLLGACGSDDDNAVANTGATGGAPTGGGETPTSDAPAGGGSAGTVLAKAADVPADGGLLAGTVMLVKLADGTVKAYDAHCPHKGVLISPPKGGKLECPAHHSLFQAADGAKISGPTPGGLKDIPVKVDGGNVVTTA